MDIRSALGPKGSGAAAPVSRRCFLRVGALGAWGLTLTDLLKLRAESGRPASDTSVLLVWLPGGPSHIDTFDPKPDAPSEIRGVFRPIPTTVPGMELSELLPRHAKIADKFSLIRSIHHDFGDHGGAHKRFMTGRIPASPGGFVNDAPAVSSCISRIREKTGPPIPNNIALTDQGHDKVDLYTLGSAYLGARYNPFMIGGDPSKGDFKVRDLELRPEVADRMEGRLALVKGLDSLRTELDKSSQMEAFDSYSRRAVDLLTSPRTREAFDLSKEGARTRDRYGRHTYGQRTLLGRRLIEAGASFVTVVLDSPVPEPDLPKGTQRSWDAHSAACHLFDDLRFRMPPFDQAVTALIEDVYARGLDRKVMVIVTGEMGRTPRLEQSQGRPGRDHWPNAMSLIVAGGGTRTGQVIGATDKMGASPIERALTPNDLWATAYRFLGIDPEATFDDHSGRPMPLLPFGEPIKELI